ncbi:Crp/Fnr family transcriptional regulator [Echinicola jeungdonensis]|uniref:Crp/Fnr family transcriptional regulator n=1 Tax=Echinicola jeungdonensis TaxID=709343 RepID=A0ABV5J0T4_9BACT|nr:Crp/Fnr family transcriptional regulator [Echinicola jeungdonensis]MDN3668265.1 Crp/Fnr family transcriptional regulator [Echinicola jeungdonensis]
MKDPHYLLEQKIENSIKLSPPEKELIKSSFNFISKGKNEHLMKSGETSRHLYFIVKGYVRTYHVNETGEEVTTSLAGEGDLMASFESFLKEIPSHENIQCVTSCELLKISREGYNNLFKEVLHWPEFCKGVYEKYILKMGQRLLGMQKWSASERYEKLLESDPKLVGEIPVKYLASYIGVKPQSLSRIRADIK